MKYPILLISTYLSYPFDLFAHHTNMADTCTWKDLDLVPEVSEKTIVASSLNVTIHDEFHEFDQCFDEAVGANRRNTPCSRYNHFRKIPSIVSDTDKPTHNSQSNLT